MMVTTFEKGVAKGRAEMLLRALERRFRIPAPEALATRIRETAELSLLDQWLDWVYEAASLNDFQQRIHGGGAR